MLKAVFNCATGKDELVEMDEKEAAALEAHWAEPVPVRVDKMAELEARVAQLEALTLAGMTK